MRNEEIAYQRGFRVTEEGVTLNSLGEGVIVSINNNGYKIFGTGSKVYKENPFYNIAVHRLQAYQKYGKELYKKKIVVRHLDGDKENNSIENIVIGSYADNYKDVPSNVRKKIVAKMAKTKCSFSENEVRNMFSLRQKGLYYYQIAEIHNTTKGWVWQILNGKSTYTKRINNL